MQKRLALRAMPKTAAGLFDFEIVLDLILQVLNIIARFAEIFGINLGGDR